MKVTPLIPRWAWPCVSSLWLAVSLPAATVYTWNFESGDLSGATGDPSLSYSDGAGGATEMGTMFGSTTSLGISNINGVVANVMKFPASSGPMGYNMPTTPTPNGPTGFEGLINDYTLIFDVYYPTASDAQWRAFIQTDSAANANDADFFVDPSGGIGIGGQYDGHILPNTWYRIGFVVDGTGSLIRKYINGTLVGQQASGDLDGRWALTPAAAVPILTDNDGENAIGFVSSIQIRDVALNSGQMANLGGPDAAGIPEALADVPSFVESRFPDVNQTGVTPKPLITIVINQGDVFVDGNSIKVFLNGEDIGAVVDATFPTYTATYQVPTLLAPLAVNQLKVIWSDDAAGFKTNEWSFTVADYKTLTLSTPIYLETFDEIVEESLPDGWTVTNATTSINGSLSLDDARSDSYLNFVVISSNRLASVHGERRLNIVPVAVNGELLDSLVHGNLAYAESDVRSGNQVQVMFSPDFDLRGQTNIYISFHSIYEQNQDNIAAVESSTDKGATWLPALYMLDGPDIVRDGGGNIDAVATMNAARGDQAYGQSYGSFIGAAISPALAPFINERINDDPVESKRVEFIRLPPADNQETVRFRFMQAGTASWYFGIDDFGIYSITNAIPPTVIRPPESQLASAGADVQFNVGATGDAPLRYQWKFNGANLPLQTNDALTVFDVRSANVGDYSVVVRNLGGAVTSRVARLEIFTGCINQGLVGHYNFDTDPLDSSGRGNDGTFMGAASIVPGLVGAGAVQVTTLQDGSGTDYVTLGQPPDLLFGNSSDFSVALWAKMDTWRNDPAFISNKDWKSGGNVGFVLATDGDGHFQWNYREAAPNDRKDYDGTPGTFTAGVWRHLAVTFQRGGLARAYIDGVQVDSRTLAMGVNLPTSIDSGLPVNIGTDGTGNYTDSGNVGTTNMLIDDVGIWRRLLTAQEVSAIYSAGRAGQDLSTASTVKLKIVRDDRMVTISWPPSGCNFTLESKEKLGDATWTPVPGVVDNSVTLVANKASSFYRLRR